MKAKGRPEKTRKNIKLKDVKKIIKSYHSKAWLLTTVSNSQDYLIPVIDKINSNKKLRKYCTLK